MTFVKLDGVSKSFQGQVILQALDLTIPHGEFLVLLGPSGCGKSTLLRLLAGLEEVDQGEIWFDERNVTTTEPSERGLAMVFQSYALYPHMSVYENMAFGLKLAKRSRDEIHDAVQKAAQVLQIEHLLHRKPKDLSGGQRQRVAIGRAIVRQPGIFLFDEPLSNLDASLRAQMRVELARLHQNTGATIVYVTHDQVEAMTLGQRIVVLQGGKVAQIGTPSELYQRPINQFVAGFLGTPQMNFLNGRVQTLDQNRIVLLFENELGGATEFEWILTQSQTLMLTKLSVGQAVTLGVRSEHVLLSESVDNVPGTLPVDVLFSEHLGDTDLVYLSSAGQTLIAKIAAQSQRFEKNQPLRMYIPAPQSFLFDQHGNNLQID